MAADEELGTGSVRITLDDSAADADARRLGERLQRVLDRASRDAGRRMERNIAQAVRRISPARIRVTADTREFQRAINGLNNLGSAPLRVTPDVDRAQFEGAVQAALAGLEVSVRVVPDLDGFDAAIRAHNAPTVRVPVDVDRGALSRLSGVLGGLGNTLGAVGRATGGALRLATLGIAAAGAAKGAAALGAALAPAAGAIAALPAAFLGAKAAMGVFQLATVGVGDAMKALASGDAKKLEEVMKNLSPAARATVGEIQKLAPELKRVQQAIQDSLFEKFSGDVLAAGKNLTPLQGRLQGIAGEFGRVAAEALKFGATRDAFNGLAAVLSGTKLSLSGLATATQPLLKGFLDVAAAISVAFSGQLAGILGRTITQFGTFLSVLAASGRAVSLVQGAIGVFQQLGSIAANVGGIISGVFSAANDVGGGLLNNLQRVTGAFREFVQSAQGQEAIGNIFRTVSAVAAQLAPILSAVVRTLGGIAPALAPLFTTIGPAIAGLISALGPALAGIAPGLQALVGGLTGAIAAISDSGAFEAVGEAIGAVGKAIAPLLPVLGELIGQLVSALAPALTLVANALLPVVSAIATALTPVIAPLAGVISTLVTALTPLVTILGVTLANVITALAPLLATVAGVFTQVATALTPLIGQITSALAPVLAQLTPIIASVVASLTPLVTQLVTALLPSLPPLVDAFLAIQTAIIPLLPLGAQLVAALAPLVAQLISAAGPIIQFAAEIIKWTAISVVVPVIENTVKVITTIVGAVSAVLRGISGFVSGIVAGFKYLGTTIPALVSSLVSAVTGFFKRMPGLVLAALSSLVGLLTGVFNAAKSAVLSAVTSLVGSAIGLIRSLPGKAAAALSGIGGALAAAGASLINGFISGIRSKLSAVKDTLGGLTSKLTDWKGPRKLDRIILTPAGKAVIDGFIKGLEGQYPAVRKTLAGLTGQLQRAVDAGKIRFGDAFLASLKSSTAQLSALAGQRQKVLDRIKAANEFAASTASAALGSFSLQNVAGQGNGGIGSVTNGLTIALNQVKRFNDQVNALARRGLRKDLLGQIIGLGPDQGGALAATLAAASGRQLRELNDVQKQLAAASVKLGKDSADALFDAGKNASKGFLAGLKSQQKDIQDLMITIARASAKAIRNALGIHSPSTLFRGIGRHTMDGLGLGVEDRFAGLRRTAARAARTLTDPFGGDVGVSLSGASSSRQGATQSRAGGRTSGPVTVNLNGTGYSDVDARRVVNRIVAMAGAL